MTIDIDGEALHLLDQFIFYASNYASRMADAMWYCEEGFAFRVRLLKSAFDRAAAENPHRCHQIAGGLVHE